MQNFDGFANFYAFRFKLIPKYIVILSPEFIMIELYKS